MISQILKITLTASSIMLSGCTLALMGGAGAGGYYVGSDDRSIGVISNDASITASVKTTLFRDDKIDAMDIDVDTFRGVVTLHGHVPSRKLASRSVKLAYSNKDVKKVISKLAIIP